MEFSLTWPQPWQGSICILRILICKIHSHHAFACHGTTLIAKRHCTYPTELGIFRAEQFAWWDQGQSRTETLPQDAPANWLEWLLSTWKNLMMDSSSYSRIQPINTERSNVCTQEYQCCDLFSGRSKSLRWLDSERRLADLGTSLQQTNGEFWVPFLGMTIEWTSKVTSPLARNMKAGQIRQSPVEGRGPAFCWTWPLVIEVSTDVDAPNTRRWMQAIFIPSTACYKCNMNAVLIMFPSSQSHSSSNHRDMHQAEDPPVRTILSMACKTFYHPQRPARLR